MLIKALSQTWTGTVMEKDAKIISPLLKHMPSCVDAADIKQLVRDIPVQPPVVVVPVRTVQDAVAAGDLPPLDVDAANVFSRSKRILRDHFRRHNTNAAELKDLIQIVLHHSDFNADVDHDMRKRLMRAIEEGDIEFIDMWEDGDGPQDNTFVKRKVSKVFMELLSDERMAGHQHFGFKLSTDANGDRVFGGDANGSLTFELAQIRAGPGQFRFPSFCTSMPRTSRTGPPSGPFTVSKPVISYMI